MVPPAPARARNAAATREAILASARRHFARESYENVGLREIASEAGVDPALVGRYFGGKEQLFVEAVRGGKQHLMHDVARADLPGHFAALLLDGGDHEDHAAKIEGLLIMLRSASSPKASEIIRDALDQDMLCPVASLLEGRDAEVRVSLCLAVLMGAGILRSAMAFGPLCTTDHAMLHRRLVRLFEAALEDREPLSA